MNDCIGNISKTPSVIIKNNIFERVLTRRILVTTYIHSNISITENTFQLFDTPVLFARDVNELTFEGNKIIERKLLGFPVGNKPSLNIEHCNDVLLQNNDFNNRSD